MRKAFTMIELIFVIVIIGILASVAIPKLSASREDALASKELLNLSQYINDVTTYYAATGTANASHTNIVIANASNSSADLNCFHSSISSDNATLSLSISNGGTSDGENYCNAAQKAALKKGLEGSKFVTFSGALVSY